MATVSSRSLCSEFVSGTLFSAALVGAGVFEPSIIKGQMDFSNNTMITVFLGASATSAIIMDIEDRLKLMRKKHRAPSNLGLFRYDGNCVGGSMIGIGMAMTGAWYVNRSNEIVSVHMSRDTLTPPPGTSLVQMGVGTANGVLVFLGGLLGATAFVKLQPRLRKIRASLQELEPSIMDDSAETKPRDIATALGVHPMTILLVWVPMCLAVMLTAYAKDSTTHSIPASGLVRPAYGGLLIGAAQLGTTLLAGHQLGASSAYEDAATWLNQQFQGKSEDGSRTALLTPSLLFASGVVAAAATLSFAVPKIGLAAAASSSSLLDPRYSGITMLGGACMVFGARLAGGCTSGHGISGLSKFSLTSLVTTASMFTAGILTAASVGV